jgi:hypothetical protein
VIGLPTHRQSYTGAGIGIHVPTRGRNLHPDTATRNLGCLAAGRSWGRRADAALTSSFGRASSSARGFEWRCTSSTKLAIMFD